MEKRTDGTGKLLAGSVASEVDSSLLVDVMWHWLLHIRNLGQGTGPERTMIGW